MSKSPSEHPGKTPPDLGLGNVQEVKGYTDRKQVHPKKWRFQVPTFVVLFLLSAALMFLVVARPSLEDLEAQEKNAKSLRDSSAKGYVTLSDSFEGSSGVRFLTYTFTFTDADGVARTASASQAPGSFDVDSEAYLDGKVIEVSFEAANPSTNAVIDDLWSSKPDTSKLNLGIFYILGGFWLLWFLMGFTKHKRRYRGLGIDVG